MSQDNGNSSNEDTNNFLDNSISNNNRIEETQKIEQAIEEKELSKKKLHIAWRRGRILEMLADGRTNQTEMAAELKVSDTVIAQLRSFSISLLPPGMANYDWIKDTLAHISRLPTTLRQVADQARSIALAIQGTVGAYLTAVSTGASSVLSRVFGQAAETLKQIGSRVMGPLLIIDRGVITEQLRRMEEMDPRRGGAI